MERPFLTYLSRHTQLAMEEKATCRICFVEVRNLKFLTTDSVGEKINQAMLSGSVVYVAFFNIFRWTYFMIWLALRE